MKLKSYFSGTVEAAMELARQELGEDALLVNARPATPETRYLGAYEVVFGVLPRTRPVSPETAAVPTRDAQQGAARQSTAPESTASESQLSRSTARPAPNNRPAPHNPNADLAQEVAGLKYEFERMMRAFMERHAPEFSASPLPAAWGEPAFQEPALQEPAFQEPALQEAALQEAPPAYPVYDVDSQLGRPGAARSVVVLVGPPGVGKTTTLVKLAARYGLAARRTVRICSTDVYRIAAADQLRSLASILGIGCDVIETAGALAQALEEHHSKDFIFVDTPGLARVDMDDAADLAALISAHPEMDTHLVLPAFMRASDMTRAIQQYAVFGPRKLLFTRVDETAAHQDMVAVAAQHGLPISFLGTGQQIPDDLEPAERNRIDAWLETAWLETTARNLPAPALRPAPSLRARTRGAAA